MDAGEGGTKRASQREIMGNAALASIRFSGLPENRAPVIAEARRGEIRWS